jgi:hypothetical protein
VEVDGCPLCRGVWFDADEIERIGRMFGNAPEAVASGVAAAVDPAFPLDVAGGVLSAVFEFLAGLFSPL